VIHSPGGRVECGDTIHDVIKSLRPRVRMIGTGLGRLRRHAHLPGRRPARTASACRTRASWCTSPPAASAARPRTSRSKPRKYLKAQDRINRTIAGREPASGCRRSRTTPSRNFWMFGRGSQGLWPGEPHQLERIDLGVSRDGGSALVAGRRRLSGCIRASLS